MLLATMVSELSFPEQSAKHWLIFIALHARFQIQVLLMKLMLQNVLCYHKQCYLDA